jgi:oxaloacetate decarboxylase alpha subunit
MAYMLAAGQGAQMTVRILDTTFRDGAQSLWAMAIRYGMMEAVAADMDNAGFAVIEVPANAIHFKKYIRDLKENPFDLMRMLARKMPRTPKAAMGGALNLNPFGTPTPRALGELFWKTLFDIGVLNRLQTTVNTADQLKRQLPTLAPLLKGIGYKLDWPSHTRFRHVIRTSTMPKKHAGRRP